MDFLDCLNTAMLHIYHRLHRQFTRCEDERTNYNHVHDKSAILLFSYGNKMQTCCYLTP